MTGPGMPRGGHKDNTRTMKVRMVDFLFGAIERKERKFEEMKKNFEEKQLSLSYISR